MQTPEINDNIRNSPVSYSIHAHKNHDAILLSLTELKNSKIEDMIMN